MGHDGGSDVWRVEEGDCLELMRAMPDGCCSLACTSPPYSAQRTYSIDYRLEGERWVEWMAPRVVEACRVTAGLVCVNMAGPVKDHSYRPVVEWLVSDLTRHHGLVCGPAPYVYFRFGIPGSGGAHYHRRDWEPVYCFCRPDVLPLAWSDNTAEGHPPRWAPGGEMSNRLRSGQRVGKFGAGGRTSAGRKADGTKDPVKNSSIREDVVVGESGPGLFGEPAPGKPGVRDALGCTASSSRRRTGSGKVEQTGARKVITRPREGQHSQESTTYDPPTLANPGNVVRERYDAEQVRQLLEDLVTCKIEPGDVVRCLAGGNHMGSPLAHDNEAPYPERLAGFFVRSYCPPGGVVLDPFCGSGTTGAVAVRLGRRFVGFDVRPDQVELTRRRLSAETPDLFGGGA
jgi:hypothetical protein